MPSIKTDKPSVISAYRSALQTLKCFKLLWVPFFIFAAIETVFLLLLFLAPRVPFVYVIGPIIRTIWGERFLHYPGNFLLLPKLASLSRMGLAIFCGSLLTGMAVALTLAVYNKQQLNIGEAFKNVIKKYVSLFIIVYIFSLLYYVGVKLLTKGLMMYFLAGHARLLFLKAQAWLGPVSVVLGFIFALFIQSAFAFAVPLLIIEKEKLIRAIGRSFVIFKKLFFRTLLLMLLPMLLYVPVIILNYYNGYLIDTLFPEFVLVVMLLSVVMNSLIIDPLVTISSTYFYLQYREKKS